MSETKEEKLKEMSFVVKEYQIATITKKKKFFRKPIEIKSFYPRHILAKNGVPAPLIPRILNNKCDSYQDKNGIYVYSTIQDEIQHTLLKNLNMKFISIKNRNDYFPETAIIEYMENEK